jgi:hypothetical protein
MGFFGNLFSPSKNKARNIVRTAVDQSMQIKTVVAQHCSSNVLGINQVVIDCGDVDVCNIEGNNFNVDVSSSVLCFQDANVTSAVSSEIKNFMQQSATQLTQGLDLTSGSQSSTNIHTSYMRLSILIANSLTQTCTSQILAKNNLVIEAGRARALNISGQNFDISIDAAVKCTQNAVIESSEYAVAVDTVAQAIDQQDLGVSLGSLLGLDTNGMMMLAIAAVGVGGLLLVLKFGGGSKQQGGGLTFNQTIPAQGASPLPQNS